MHFISYFCLKFNVFMKKVKQYIGIYLIILGTLVLMLTRIDSLASMNTLLIAGLLLIVSGIVLHIRSIKGDSEY